MAVERKDPLPVGRYWVVVFERDNAKWDQWIKQFSPDRVKVRATAGLDPAGVLGNLLGSAAPGYWVQFDVVQPTPWVGIGYPTIVPGGAPTPTSPTDVIQAPPPETSEGLASELAGKALLFGGAALVGIFLLARLTR